MTGKAFLFKDRRDLGMFKDAHVLRAREKIKEQGI